MKRWIWTLVTMSVLGVASVASADTGAGTQSPYVPAGGYETTTAAPAGGGAPAGDPAATGAATPGGARWQTRFVERGMTTPERTLGIQGTIGVFHIDGAPDEFVSASFGGSFGITNDLEVGATVLPLLLSPDFEYADPTVYGLFRLVDGTFELGLRARLVLPVRDEDEAGRAFAFGIDVPMGYHVGNFGRFDFGIEYTGVLLLDAPEGADSFAYLWGIPVSYFINITDELFAGLDTGLFWSKFDIDETATIPLGLRIGYTIAGPQGPLADIAGFFTWPVFLTPGNGAVLRVDPFGSVPIGGTGADIDTVHPDIFFVGVTGRVFLYL